MFQNLIKNFPVEDEPEDNIESIETPTYDVLFRKPGKGKLSIKLPKIKLQKNYKKPKRKKSGLVQRSVQRM